MEKKREDARMRYTINGNKTIPLKGGKVKYEVYTDQGTFQTWDQSIGTARSGTVVDAIAEPKTWNSRNGPQTDMMLKLVEGGGQPGAAASPGQPPAQREQSGGVKSNNQFIAVEAVKLAIDTGGHQTPEAEVMARACKYADIMLAVLKDIDTPKWEKAVRAAGLVKDIRSVGMARADLESMFVLAQGDVDKFIDVVKVTIAAKRSPPPPATTTTPIEDDDLPF